MRIQQLPPALANQIAAGEVIERPASVVKELLENALDAGATQIAIDIGYGGLNQIKISDNGSGIVADDLPLSIAPHATSKIRSLDDLHSIESMGFRGEALASIASVAKVTISSRTAAQEHAMMLRTQNGNTQLAPCARSPGTSIEVLDLFFNAPVRKRFLKNEKLEFQAIEQVVKRFALSAQNIAITLKHDNRVILNLPAAQNESARIARLNKLFGKAFMQDAVFLDVTLSDLRLHGWISGCGYQRSQNDRQWVYINQRMVKDKLIQHALKQAYDGLLYPGRFPACLLYFTIPGAEIDVNVHPTKHEVRFAQPRLVHDFFTSQLSKALNTARIETEEVAQEWSADLEDSTTEIAEAIAPFSTWQIADTRNKSSADFPWITLNTRYILIFLQQLPYVVDLLALQQRMVKQHLLAATLPLQSRPLLVPVSMSLPATLQGREAEVVHFLAQAGIQASVNPTHQITFRSMPVSVPYLDFRRLLDLLTAPEDTAIESVSHLLSLAQQVAIDQLSAEERSEINQVLSTLQAHESLLKLLTIEDCRMLMHA